MVDFKSIKPAEFKPEMIVGKYFVECKSDPKAQILLAQEKQVYICWKALFINHFRLSLETNFRRRLV